MRFASQAAVLILAACAALDHRGAFAAAKKPSSRSSGSGSRRPSSSSYSSRSGPSSRSSGRPPVSRRRYDDEEEYEGEEEFDFDDPFDEEEEDEYEPEEPVRRPSRSSPSSSSRKSGRQSRPAQRKRPSGSRSRQHDDYDDHEYEYDRPRRTSQGGKRPGQRPSKNRPPGRRGRGSVVPYPARKKPSTFTRGLEKLKNSMPDPAAVKNAAVNSLNAARETTSNLSSNVYREVKGLTSSELEQVMLKATRPDDTAVKGKHVERLVGVTYQISARYDIYDAVLRKLWSKMAEKDWRTTIKALYILHRFSADGAPEHAPSLKARLRELRRTRDPKRKKKLYNSEQLLAGDNKEETAKFRAFMSRYAHYVLLRVQCFGGMFDEISLEPGKQDGKKKKSSSSSKSRSNKPITSTCLRVEHLDASALLLKAGIGCQLKSGEECENTAIAAERVASDLIGLTSAVAKALNRALGDGDDDDEGELDEAAGSSSSVDAGLIRRWCEFYSEDLLPQTKSMVKRTTPKLDAFGLFLPSRWGASVSRDALQRGLKLEGSSSSAPVPSDDAAAVEDDGEEEEEDEGADAPSSKKKVAADDGDDEEEEEEEQTPTEEGEDDEVDEGEEVYDEYEYDVEEYYDDEDPF